MPFTVVVRQYLIKDRLEINRCGVMTRYLWQRKFNDLITEMYLERFNATTKTVSVLYSLQINAE